MTGTLRSDPGVIWWLYFVRCQNGRVYTGISPNPEMRFIAHLSRKSAHMRINKPEQLIGAAPVGDYKEACALERKAKRLTREQKLALAASFSSLFDTSAQIDGQPTSEATSI